MNVLYNNIVQNWGKVGGLTTIKKIQFFAEQVETKIQ